MAAILYIKYGNITYQIEQNYEFYPLLELCNHNMTIYRDGGIRVFRWGGVVWVDGDNKTFVNMI